MESPARGETDARLARAAYVVAALALACAGFFPINNPDTFGHLAQGRQIAQLGHVPMYDSFSFFRPTPQLWSNYEWLSDLLTWKLYALGGPNALLYVKCLMLALSAVLLVRLAELLGGARAAVIACLLIVVAIPASRFRLTERPHLLALPLSAIYFLGLSYLMRGYGQARRVVDVAWIGALTLLHLVWVNLHGSHLLGLAITGVCCAVGFFDARARWKLVLVVASQLVVSCISPYGPDILIDAVAHVANPVYRKLVSEWEPWQPSDPFWLFASPILHTLLLIACVPRLLRGGTVTRALFASVCVLGLASFRSIRFVAEYLLLGAPVLALALAVMLQRISSRALAVGCAAVLVPCTVLVPWGSARLPPYLPFDNGTMLLRLPVASGRWLERHARSPRVLAAIEDSWYLMFAVPQARFLVDGRVPFYGADHLAYVGRAFNDRATLLATLAEYRIDTVVVRHTYKMQRKIFDNLRALPEFRVVSIEDRYATFVREDLPLVPGDTLRPFVALQPSYDHAWLTGADDARARAILTELSRLPDDESTRGYRGFVRAMLALRPFQRTGENNGLRAPANDAERATLRKAQAWLARASKGADGVPIVDAYHGLVSVLLCDFDAARAAFELARREHESRETLLGAQEMAVRTGDAASVQAFLAAAAAAPQAAGDVWLGALHDELQVTPRCQ
ncbi:MAG TPA: hypothetical protein VHM19_09420 [Polyangiales bacterium]|nr:hypothetical protein [Polyangiales bacterium]